MKVGVRLQAILRQYRPAGFQGDVVQVDLPETATVRDAADALGVPVKLIHAVFVNDEHATLDTPLAPDHVIRLFPPVVGGQRTLRRHSLVVGHTMRIFIAGIMQGSRRDNGVDDQGYRQRITTAIRARFPDADVVDPWVLHPQSPTYGDVQGRQAFMEFNDAAATADVLVAYVPEASMGTAIEMWQAYKAGARVLTISPLAENWVVKFLSDRVFATLDEFTQFVARGELEALFADR